MKIRTAVEQDIGVIVEIQSGAFRFREDAARCRRLADDLAQHLDGWLVLPVDDRVVATVQVHCGRLRIGRSAVLKGDVGAVAVHPDLHGQGYGSELMAQTVLWMRERRFDLSRLGGLVRFYSRFGYLRFPRRYMEFTVGQVSRAGASSLRDGELPISEEARERIRSFDPQKDGAGFWKLVESFNLPYVGSPIPTNDDLPPPSALFLVFEEDGCPVGFLRAHEYPADHSEFEARITIPELGYERDKPYALQNLIRYVSNYALGKGISRITARIPFDPQIIAALAELPIRFQTIETHGGQAANMLQIINLMTLFENLIPELEERMSRSLASSWSGTLQVAIEKAAVDLAIHDGRIRVTEAGKPDLYLKISEYQMLQLVLGLLSYEELPIRLSDTHSLKPPDVDLLRVLFPRRPVYSGAWG